MRAERPARTGFPRESRGLGAFVSPFLELGGLWTLAVVQPVFSDLAASAEVLLLRRSTSADITEFSLALALLPPLAIATVIWAVGLASSRLGRLFHVALLGALAAIWVSQLAISGGFGRELSWVLAAVASPILAAARLRSEAVAVWLKALAPLSLVLVAWFLLVSPVAELVGDETDGSVAELTTEPALTPVLFIVFDELPTLSLMGPDGEINESMFPNFARLAKSATWYRNHTSAAESTWNSMPGLLTGLGTDNWTFPVFARHPNNLFSLLGGTHALNIQEYTAMCPPDLECRARAFSAGGELRDLLVLAGEITVNRLGFDTDDDLADEPRGSSDTALRLDLDWAAIAEGVPTSIDAFMEGFIPDGGPRLDFFHLLLPHQPWVWAGDTRITNAPLAQRDSIFGTWIDETSAWSNMARHLLQLQHADGVLGDILDELDRAGVLDDTMVVLTSDHGVSFQGGLPSRLPESDNLHELFWTPLIIKYPGQVTGATIDSPVSALDVLPTIAAVLGVDLPWESDGLSLVPAPPDSDRPRRLFVGDRSDLETDGMVYRLTSDEYFARLLSAARSRDISRTADLGHFGPYSFMVGEPVTAFVPDRIDPSITLDGTSLVSHGGLERGSEGAPLWIEGRTNDPSVKAVAVSVSGTIVAAIPVDGATGSMAFWWVVSPGTLGDELSDVVLHEIRGTPESPTLGPAFTG